MSRLARCMTVLWSGLLLSPVVLAQNVLEPNNSFLFTVPETPVDTVQISTEFLIEVPISARALSVTLESSDPSRNFDLFARVGSSYPEIVSLNGLFDDSSYVSISENSNEAFIAQDFATPSVSGEIMILVIAIFSGPEVSLTLTLTTDEQPAPQALAEIRYDNPDNDPDCLTDPWFDTTPITPFSGNSATTLGAARRNAMQAAADLTMASLTSRVPVVITACWSNEGFDEDGPFTLAFASSNDFSRLAKGLPDPVFHSRPAYERLGGAESCQLVGGPCNETDIFISFNLDVDELPAQPLWNYSLNRVFNNQGADFISVAMHELTHGLGFVSTLDSDGVLSSSNGQLITDAFTENLGFKIASGDVIPLASNQLSNADRAAALISDNGLVWIDDRANVTSDNGFFQDSSRDGRVQIYAPNPYEEGSSGSHIDLGDCTLMEAFLSACDNGRFIRELGMARQMLHAMGWHSEPDTSPYNGFYFDVERDGHGFEFVPAGVNGSGETVYVLTFYSYDSSRQPEWFQAIGVIREGAFIGERNSDSDSLVRYLFDEQDSPPQTASAAAIGQGVLSFNAPERSRACAGRSESGLAVFQWRLGNDLDEWCVKPLIPDSLRPETDFSGLWFAGGADQGWGLSIANFAPSASFNSLFIVLYVYDNNGQPIWYFGTLDSFTAGQPFTMDLIQRDGYRRTANSLPLVDEVAGQLVMTLQTPSQSLNDGNVIDSLRVEFQDAPGGVWERNQIAIQRLSTESAAN